MSETLFTPSFTRRDRDRPARLYILAGIPGCGKSTWAKALFQDYQTVSSDAIREELWPGEEYDASRNAKVFDTFHKRIKDMLYKGSAVVADATSLAALARQKLREIANDTDAECHLIFFNNQFQAFKRNNEREGNTCVPPEDMALMLSKFNECRSAILVEDYTSITIIGSTYAEPATTGADDPEDSCRSTGLPA